MDGRKVTIWAGAAALAVASFAQAAKPRASDFAAALANPERPEADRARDSDRKPAEVMAFAGIRPGLRIAEVAPGGGYFTRLLGQAVGASGHVFGLGPRPSPAVEGWAASHANVSYTVAAGGSIPVTEPVDMVWTTLNYHDFKNAKLGESDAAIETDKAAFRALKPGGIYLIIDHAAAPGAGASQTSTLHRIEPAFVRREVEGAGFVLDAQSDLLRHPADDHLTRVQESGIRGKTDQFIFRFRKPRK